MEIIYSMNPYTKLFLGLLSLKVIIQNYLDLRQRKSLRQNHQAVPLEFQETISLEEHQKATNYNLEKISFGKICRSYRLILLLIWTLGGGFEFLSYLFFKSGETVSQIALFLTSFILIETILSLPLSFYSTFVIEEKYGFNKTTKKIFFIDTLKSLFITTLLSLPLLIGLIKIIEMLGMHWWFYAWAGFLIFQFTLIFLYPKFIAPLFNKFSRLEDESLNQKIFELLSKVNFQAKELFVMDASKRSTHGNAYFTGFGKNKRIVFFDTLLEKMNHNEILAILAHELGHFKKRHILQSLILSSFGLLIIFYFLGVNLQNNDFFMGHGLNFQTKVTSIMMFFAVLPTYTFLLTPLGNIFSRKNEFEADDFASSHTSSKDLQSALLKLYKFNHGALCPDSLYSSFYDSHPPASIRLKNLKKQNS